MFLEPLFPQPHCKRLKHNCDSATTGPGRKDAPSGLALEGPGQKMGTTASSTAAPWLHFHRALQTFQERAAIHDETGKKVTISSTHALANYCGSHGLELANEVILRTFSLKYEDQVNAIEALHQIKLSIGAGEASKHREYITRMQDFAYFEPEARNAYTRSAAAASDLGSPPPPPGSAAGQGSSSRDWESLSAKERQPFFDHVGRRDLHNISGQFWARTPDEQGAEKSRIVDPELVSTAPIANLANCLKVPNPVLQKAAAETIALLTEEKELFARMDETRLAFVPAQEELANPSSRYQLRKRFGTPDVLRGLVLMAVEKNEDLQEVGMRAISNLSLHPANRRVIMAEDGLRALYIEMLASDLHVRQLAVRAVANILMQPAKQCTFHKTGRSKAVQELYTLVTTGPAGKHQTWYV